MFNINKVSTVLSRLLQRRFNL